MNKKLLALAIGAAITMPVAALAEGPTLYGQLDVSLENLDNGTVDTWTIEDNASRLGVKGSAETGVDGLKGIYLAEFGLNADDGDVDGVAASADPISQRNIYVGLQGNFGTVLMGNVDTPTKTVQGKVDQFNDSNADMAAYLAGEFRAPNILAYATPKLGDAFTATVALWQSEVAGDGVGEAISASAVYQQDALYIGVGMDMEVPSAGGVAVTAGSLNDITRVVAGYTTDAFEIGFLYQMAEETVAANEDTSMILSGAFKSGDLKVKAQYGTTDGDTAGVTNTETMLALGADYAAGKSTTIYGFVAMNEDDAALDNTLLSLGIKQKF